MKSRDQKKGIFSSIVGVFRWFWAPRQNPHAAEDRADQRRREKRRRAAQASAKAPVKSSSKKAVSSAAREQELAYVDKAGNVRLADGGRVVARGSKGSKAGALAEARALYQTRAGTLATLQGQIADPQASVADVEPHVAQLRSDLRDAPGLGDLEALESGFAALVAALETRTQAQWDLKRGIITRLEALSTAAPSGLSTQIEQLGEEWTQSGSAGAVHDTVLERRYAAARETVLKRARMAEDHPEVFIAERQSVLNELVDLMASPDRTNMAAQLAGLQAAWLKAGGTDDEAMNQQFQQMSAAIERDIHALASETQTLRTALEQEARTLEATCDGLAEDGAALTDGRSLRGLSKSVSALERRADGAHRDLTDKLRRRVDDLHWRADREIERRQALVVSLTDSARQSLAKAAQLPAEIATMKEWRGIEDAAKAGMEGAEAAMNQLKGLGRLGAEESSRISADLRTARKALNEARKAFFETLDESRESNSFRKRALLDRLSHPPVGATVKELDTHVDQVMADWKQAGSAGRDTDQALWAEFQDVRTGIRKLRDEASAAERDDFGARLAESFTRKRELAYTIEDEIRMGRLVLENQSDAKFEKELRRKERRLESLQKDLSDIQRKLKKLSNAKSKAGSEPPKVEGPAQATDHAA